MRHLRQLAWAAVVALATAGPVAAQGVGGTTAPSISASGSTAGGTGGNGGGNGGGNTGGNTSGNSASGSLGGSALATMQSAPNLSLSTTTNSTSTVLSQSNGLGRFYANPYYLGTYTNSINPSAQPGGFGSTLYQTGGATGGGQIGFSGTSATTGAAGGRGGATGTGGGVSATVTDAGGVLIPLPRQIAYPARVKFAVAPVASTQLQADLRGLIGRSAMLTNPTAVRVDMDGNAVILRGAVRDEDEAKLVEGLVRLTPGVGMIRNELAFPQP